MKSVIVSICVLLPFLGLSHAYLFITDEALTRMIQLMPDKPYCYFYTDRDFIEDTVKNENEENLKITTTEEIEKLCNLCRDQRISSSYQGGFIYPGTRWCGPGTSAKTYEDLGKHRLVDMCCREHDNCPQSFERGECKQGLCNKSLFTRSHCDCDMEFQKCLQNAHSETANTIGAIFFNVAEVICFREDDECPTKTRLESGRFVSVNTKNCTLKFSQAGRYIPSETIFYGTRGEVVEKSLINRLLRKLNLL